MRTLTFGKLAMTLSASLTGAGIAPCSGSGPGSCKMFAGGSSPVSAMAKVSAYSLSPSTYIGTYMKHKNATKC